MPTGFQDPRAWLDYIAKTFERGSLYFQFWTQMQNDPAILDLLALVQKDQPIQVLFFSVVNFLLLQDIHANRSHPLALFYPYLCADPLPATEAYPVFHDFCTAHLTELQRLLPTVRLQTNEPTRCANLLPAFELAFRNGGRNPLALIELGSSAGLNLLWPQYGYEYKARSGGSIYVGNPHSPVQLQCSLNSEIFPPLPDDTILPTIAQCLGIELYPVDITQDNQVDWLRACIWPEEHHRYRTLDAALLMAHAIPPAVLSGDASNLLPHLLATVPVDQTVCIWHSFALNQGPMQVKERIEQQIVAASRQRPIYRISLEAFPHHELPRLELFTYRDGACEQEWLANCSIHGEQMEWRLPISTY